MKIKTSELIGPALDWAVATAEGHKPPLLRVLRGNVALPQEDDPMWCDYLEYSTNWAQGGPIIEVNHIHTWTDRKDASYAGHPDSYWVSEMTELGGIWWGETPLIAAMRCYVSSKLGDEVEVPDELVK